MKLLRNLLALLLVIAVGGALAYAIKERLEATEAGGGARTERGPVPVEIAPVERGDIVLRRSFSGTLEAPAEFVVAPKVSGRVVELMVDLADDVVRNQIVARLDDDEFQHAVTQAEAEVAVAHATQSEAESSLEIAGRALERAEVLYGSNIASETELDTFRADHLAKRAALEVAKARVTRAEAALEAARIRLGYTQVVAGWRGNDDTRVVAARFVDEGETVSANSPLLSIVELEPLNAIIFVSERDYARLELGQSATLRTDAHPGRDFPAEVARVAPVFRAASRQARVELTVENEDHELKPGMFVRAEVLLDRADDVTIVPVEALAKRAGQDVLFVLDAEGTSVAMRPVERGIRDGERIEVRGDGIVGSVVTLGQQLLEDGSRVAVAGRSLPVGSSQDAEMPGREITAVE